MISSIDRLILPRASAVRGYTGATRDRRSDVAERHSVVRREPHPVVRREPYPVLARSPHAVEGTCGMVPRLSRAPEDGHVARRPGPIRGCTQRRRIRAARSRTSDATARPPTVTGPAGAFGVALSASPARDARLLCRRDQSAFLQIRVARLIIPQPAAASAALVTPLVRTDLAGCAPRVCA